MSRCWRVLAGLLLALTLQPAAQAGLVTGAWDPQFGSFLPGLSWQVRAEVLVPNACANQADGVYSTAGGPCSNANPAEFSFLNVWVRFFDTGLADPGDFFEVNGPSGHSGVFDLGPPTSFIASQVRVQAGQIVGFETNSASLETWSCCTSSGGDYSSIASAEANRFNFRFTVNGPSLVCIGCVSQAADRFADPYNADPVNPRGDVASETGDLQQFLVTYTGNDATSPKYVDSAGSAAGARLDNQGNYVGFGTAINQAAVGQVTQVTQVPEPASLLLVLPALAGLGLSRRRAAQRG